MIAPLITALAVFTLTTFATFATFAMSSFAGTDFSVGCPSVKRFVAGW
jgi:hypothetical protein